MDTVAIDWSGAKGALRQICLARTHDGLLVDLRSGISREGVIEELIDLGNSLQDPLVVGLDFAFSLPGWFTREMGLSTARELWLLVDQRGEDWLKACEPPFWGRPGRTKPVLESHFRRTEANLRPVAGISVKSPFQIGGAGAVGTASLRGMPFLALLQDAGFSIWPFDEPRFPMVIEIYPRLLTGPVVKSSPAACQGYLERMPALALDPSLALLAASSEDAFDAAVSAIVMSQHAEEFTALTHVEDPTVKLEGEIWAPASATRLSEPFLPTQPTPADKHPSTPARPGPTYGLRYTAALGYASELHATQLRKGTTIPYISHLLAVSALVWEAGGDEGQAIAALLHDAVEDQGGQSILEMIRLRFGDPVAAIVEVCTDTDEIPKPPWRARKEAHIAHMADASLDALLVVAADKLHNAICTLADVRAGGPKTWDRFNGGRDGTVWYYQQMHSVLARRMADCPLVLRLDEVVANMAASSGE